MAMCPPRVPQPRSIIPAPSRFDVLSTGHRPGGGQIAICPYGLVSVYASPPPMTCAGVGTWGRCAGEPLVDRGHGQIAICPYSVIGVDGSLAGWGGIGGA